MNFDDLRYKLKINKYTSNIDIYEEIKKFNPNLYISESILIDDVLFNKFIKDLNGVNVRGYFTSAVGLGQNGRFVVETLKKKNIPYVINNINVGDVYDYKNTNINPFSTNIICHNPDMPIDDKYLKNKRNIALWAWELEEVPTSWKKESMKYDEIWTVSNFCKDIFYRELPNKNIKVLHIITHTNKLDKNKCKKYFNIDPNDFVFLFVFDYNSDIYRKNPQGLIEAFNKAFKNNDNVKLVIKCHDLPENILKLSDNIILINQTLLSDEFDKLMNLSDVYISLHRSEGCGLTILESIMLSKPIICTNYSGNLDFCDEKFMELVNYKMIPVNENSVYKKYFKYDENEIYYADPDINDASEKMIKVFNNFKHYQSLSNKFKKIVNNRLNSDFEI